MAYTSVLLPKGVWTLVSATDTVYQVRTPGTDIVWIYEGTTLPVTTPLLGANTPYWILGEPVQGSAIHQDRKFVGDVGESLYMYAQDHDTVVVLAGDKVV